MTSEAPVLSRHSVERSRAKTDSLSERVEAEPEIKPTRVIYIPGIFATNSRKNAIDGIGNALARGYGGMENVTIYNSAVSTDTPNPNRYKEMADAIITQAREGRVDVAALSLGATELWKVIKRINKVDKSFLEDPAVKENLRFVLIAPSGFSKGIKDKLKYALNSKKLLKKDTTYDGLTVFPPEGVSSERLRQAVSVSNVTEGIPNVPFDGEDKRSRYLDDEEKRQLAYQDIALHSALVQGKKRRAANLIEKRGKHVKRAALQAAYGSPDYIPNDTKPSWKGSRGLILRALGGKPMEKFIELAERGFRVDFVVPEYDYVVPIEKVLKFFEGREEEAASHIQVVEQTSHGGPSLQGDLFVRAIKNPQAHEN